MKEFVEIVDDLLVQTVQLGALGFLQFAIELIGSQYARREWTIDAFKEFQEDYTDGITLGGEPVATRFGELLNQMLGAQFGKIIAQRTQRVLRGGQAASR